jgi:hypothetical protein
VREWRKAIAEGRQADADAIAEAYGPGKLGLNARHVKDVSPGGVEAATDLHIGHVGGLPGKGGDDSGYVLRKLYKPDSKMYGPLAYPRPDIDKVLQDKMSLTKELRSQYPGSFPDMFGVKPIGKDGAHRASYHEYVPGVRPLNRAEAGRLDMGAWQKALRGNNNRYADDVIYYRGGRPTYNEGNLMIGGDGNMKVLDFLPGKVLPNGHIDSPRFGMQFGPPSKVQNLEDLPALRKEMFQGVPGSRQAPKIRIGPPGVGGAGGIGGGAGGNIGGGAGGFDFGESGRKGLHSLGEFVRKHKVPLALGGAAATAATLGGLYALHRHNQAAANTNEAEGEEKAADVSPAVSWNGQFGGAHRQQSDIPAFRAPILSRAVQKHANVSSPRGQLSKTQHVGAPKVTAPPGPSIADIAKPKGEHFGIGIPGAFKGKI